MKKLILLALAPIAMLGTGAAAQTVVHTSIAYNNGHHWHGRHHTRRVCSMVWRHHHRVRVCRTNRW